MTENAPSTPSPLRTFIVVLASAVAAYGLFTLDSGMRPIGVVVVSALLFCAPLFNRAKTLAPQLVARALWWQALVLGIVVSVEGYHAPQGISMVLGSGLALWAAGNAGLWNNTKSFVPVAFRRTLVLSLILAIADFEALAFYGSIMLESGLNDEFFTPPALPFLVAATAMAVSIFGLYRLRVWGLVACLGSNVAIAACALGGVFDLPAPLVAGLTATAIAQLLLPIPMVRRMIQTRRLADGSGNL